jgi:hypothetical protein
VLDRIRVTLSGQLEADLTASTADILRAVADDHRRAVSNAEERVSSEARLEAAERLAIARADFDREREVLQQGATAEIEGLERALGEVRDELEVARCRLEEAQTTQNELGRELEEVRRTAEDRRNQLESLRARLGHTSQLTSAFRTLNEAATLGDILDRLAQAACQETGRTAVFLLRGERLRGWRAFGFEEAESIVGADFDSQAPDLVGLAARSGAGQHHRDGDGADLPSFAKAEGPWDAVALPVQVGGSVIAVLYADTPWADRPEEPQWVETMKALAKHAGRVLEAMTVNQAAALWRPRPDVKLPPRRRGERSSVARK